MRAHPAMSNQFSLGVAPEAFQAVDMHSSPGEVSPVIDPEVPVPAEGQRIVALVAVGVNQAPAPDEFQGGPQERGAGVTFGTTLTVTRPRRSRMPKTGILYGAPRPRLPPRVRLERWGPK